MLIPTVCKVGVVRDAGPDYFVEMTEVMSRSVPLSRYSAEMLIHYRSYRITLFLFLARRYDVNNKLETILIYTPYYANYLKLP
jgi:hypothetical protein